MRTFVFLLLSAGPVWAETCPPAPNHADALASFIADARAAETQTDADRASQGMWGLWLDAPDAAAQEVLDQGMRQRSNADYAGALASFDNLVNYCPNYAEGYNQRAFVHFLTADFPAALEDLDRALRLSPAHVGAQSGRALTLMNMGDRDAARAQMLEALENNPWLSERALVADGAPLGPVGEEL